MARRFLILAEGNFGPQTSKTANACLRYAPSEVIAILDSTCAGSTAAQVLGFGGDVPVVASFAEGMARQPSALLIGIAPAGGQLPPSWRAVVVDALRAGLDVWSGLHAMLGDDAVLAAEAAASGAAIHDLRRPPVDLDVGCGRVRDVAATIILTVGTDSNIGKMTTQLQLRNAMRNAIRNDVRNATGNATSATAPRVHFAATGQTGILIEGRGIAVDAVIADFIAGAAERLTLEAAEGADVVLVEGQGSLIHPSYSGVTLGLMHGALPHAMVLCTQPSRRTVHHNAWVPIPPVIDVVRLYEAAMQLVRPAPVIAVAMNTLGLTDAEAHAAMDAVRRETGLPVTDPVRYDVAPIVDAISTFHAKRVR